MGLHRETSTCTISSTCKLTHIPRVLVLTWHHQLSWAHPQVHQMGGYFSHSQRCSQTTSPIMPSALRKRAHTVVKMMCCSYLNSKRGKWSASGYWYRPSRFWQYATSALLHLSFPMEELEMNDRCAMSPCSLKLFRWEAKKMICNWLGNNIPSLLWDLSQF